MGLVHTILLPFQVNVDRHRVFQIRLTLGKWRARRGYALCLGVSPQLIGSARCEFFEHHRELHKLCSMGDKAHCAKIAGYFAVGALIQKPGVRSDESHS